MPDDKFEWTKKVQSLDFDRMHMLVCQRIEFLKIYAENIEKDGAGAEVNEAICRDLIFPCLSILVEFIEAVRVGEEVQKYAH